MVTKASAVEASNIRKMHSRLVTPSDKSTAAAVAAAAVAVTVLVTFRKHSVELAASKGGHFVVLSRSAYGRTWHILLATSTDLEEIARHVIGPCTYCSPYQ